LVDLFMDRLPEVEVLGHSIRATTGDLHAALAEREEVSFEVFARELREVDREIRRVRYPGGLETGTTVRFGELAKRLGLSDPEIPALLTEVHMGWILALAETPVHHAHVLANLRRSARVGLCSNFTHSATARRILDESGLSQHLDAVVISEDVGLRKPRREIFDAVLVELGAEPAETLHVGDNLEADVAGAAACGLRTAWLRRRVPDPEQALRSYKGPPPDWILDDLSELPSLLRGPASPDLCGVG
jgi:putative hydrolase of the HAD superfamily